MSNIDKTTLKVGDIILRKDPYNDSTKPDFNWKFMKITEMSPVGFHYIWHYAYDARTEGWPPNKLFSGGEELQRFDDASFERCEQIIL